MDMVRDFHIKTDDKYFALKGQEIFESFGMTPTLEQRKNMDEKLRSVAVDTIDGFIEVYNMKMPGMVEQFMNDRKPGETFLTAFRRWLKA